MASPEVVDLSESLGNPLVEEIVDPGSGPAADAARSELAPAGSARDYDANLHALYDMHAGPVAGETYHTWEIADWRGLRTNKVPGPVFSCGGFTFNLLLYPRGNNSSLIAIYLEPHPANPDDPNWHCCAQFAIDVWNPAHPHTRLFLQLHHRFHSKATDWGFLQYVGIGQMHREWRDSGHALIENNATNITVYVRVLEDPTGVLWHDFAEYDLKTETGMVGIWNQGATCYLNSLLQSYFFTQVFRRRVYEIPTEGDSSKGAHPLAVALQRVFYHLQKLEEPLSTLELTQSFGWTNVDLFTQHDVQELNRILMDKLEARMKGTPIEGCLNDIFVGKMKLYIRCVNVEYELLRLEDFWDIQLNVKGAADLAAAFRQYIEVETLLGDNQYDAVGFGLQDAHKGVLFTQFPPVLHLQLKRFEYDFVNDRIMKINDRQAFPSTIDLRPYLDPQCEAYADPDPDAWIYQLHGVLIHSGDFLLGHYYAFIRPSSDDQWYRFDDDRVFKVTPYQVFDENFGADWIAPSQAAKLSKFQYHEYQTKRYTNAYMLVYLRQRDLPTLLEPIGDDDIPQHVLRPIEQELAEHARTRKEQQEQHLYVRVHVNTSTLFQHYQGYELGPGLLPLRLYHPDLYAKELATHVARCLRTSTVRELMALLQEPCGVNADQVRLWYMTHRRNNTTRPDRLVDDWDMLLNQLAGLDDVKDVSVWVESVGQELGLVARLVEEGTLAPLDKYTPEGLAALMERVPPVVSPPETDSESAVVLIKYYDPTAPLLFGLTHAVVQRLQLVSSLVPLVALVTGTAAARWDVYEELQLGKVEQLDPHWSFSKSDLDTGDILVFQPSFHGELVATLHAPQFYARLVLRTHFQVQPRVEVDEAEAMVIADAVKPEQTTSFWASSHLTYELFVGLIARHVKVDAAYLQVWCVSYDGQRVPLTRGSPVDLLIHRHVPALQTVTVEYQELPVPLEQFERLVPLTIHWLLDKGTLVVTAYDMLVNPACSFDEVAKALQPHTGVADAQLGDVLLWNSFDHKFLDLVGGLRLVGLLSRGSVVYAGVFPVEAAALHDDDDETEEEIRLITVFLYHKEPRRTHSAPFVFGLIPDEPLAATRARLQARTGIALLEFDSKVRLSTCDTNGAVRVVWEPQHAEPVTLYSAVLDLEFLCLETADRTVHRPSGLDKPVVVDK